MAINLENLIFSGNRDSKMMDFQDLDHLDGISISTTNANLYKTNRDDVVLFYFRDGVNYASVYTQSKIVSENIKWNLSIKYKKIKALLINTINANAFTGKKGFQGLKDIAEKLSTQLSLKQKEDEENPEKIKSSQILFGAQVQLEKDFQQNKLLIAFQI